MATLQATAPDSAGADPALVNFSVRLPGIALLMAGALVLRLALAYLPGFGVDIGTFQAWANSMAANGPSNFYNETSFTDYAPGYMYILWIIGEAHQQFHFTGDQFFYVIKIPAIIADMASLWLLYKLLEGQTPATRLGAVTIYALFPAALLIGPVWGQVDSILAFFLLLSVYYIGRDKPVHGAVAFTVGFLVKPQAIAALPFLAFWIVRDRIEWRKLGASNLKLPALKDPATLALCIVVPMAVLLILIAPFFRFEPWRLIEVLNDSTNVENYRVNSFWAYNFWNFGGLYDQGFRCDLQSGCPNADATEWFGIATRYWGLAFFVTGIALVTFSLRNARGIGFLALGTALCVMVFYLFLTRMHERYMFAAFLPFLAAAVIINSRLIWGAFTALSFAHFVNLYHVFGYYYPNWNPDDGEPSIRWEWAFRWIEKGDFFGADLPLFGRLETVQLFSMLMVAVFVSMIVWVWFRVDQGRIGRRAGTT
ncbi:MAG TPA: hypothetical protein VMR52_07705 [Dehalococcoidia bacterium]|nr:hypothetical protein [Dehalococcoidia bacterium]